MKLGKIKEHMNTKENGLIAEFMGWDIISPTTIPTNLHLSNLELDNGRVMELKFDTSWDWLMPVVENINSLTDEFGNTNDFVIGNDYVWVDPHCGNRIFFSEYDPKEPMISKVYRGAVRFIKQYNLETIK